MSLRYSRHKFACIVVLVPVLWGARAAADDTDVPLFSFSGFGTLGEVHSSEDRVDFTSSTFKPNGAGYSSDWSASVDSLMAAQLNVNATSQVSAVLQVVSTQNFDDSYAPHVEWANIKYQFTPDFSVRAGRTALPIFLVSDSRLVGYANPWVRPPGEVYNLVPITNNDGVDASYRMRIGTATNTFQIAAGQSDSKFPPNLGSSAGTAEARDVVAFEDSLDEGSMTGHFTYGLTRLTIPQLTPLFDAFAQFGPEGAAIAQHYDVRGRLTSFIGVNAGYDPGTWFVLGEWGHVATHSVLGDQTGWYVTSGYRFGKFTPYLTYAAVKADSKTSDPGLTVSALPPSLAGIAMMLNARLNSILGSVATQNTLSVGERWDFAGNVDLKLQFDHVNLGAGSAGMLINAQPGFRPGSEVDLFSAAIDFVF